MDIREVVTIGLLEDVLKDNNIKLTRKEIELIEIAADDKSTADDMEEYFIKYADGRPLRNVADRLSICSTDLSHIVSNILTQLSENSPSVHVFGESLKNENERSVAKDFSSDTESTFGAD